MKKVKVLIAEDDPVAAEMLKSIVEAEGFECGVSSDGREALNFFLEKHPDIIISDINMPRMTGIELVEEIHKLNSPVVFIAESESSDPETIISMMKKGVHDYLIKPINRNELVIKLHKAVEMIALIRSKKALEDERQMRLEKQLDWNIMKERIAARSYDRFDKTLFSSLKTSFNQGAGIGALISLLSLMKKQVKLEGDKYLVGKNMLDMVFQNSDAAQKALNAITEISAILDSDFELERTPVQDFYKMIIDIKNELEPKAAIKDQHLRHNDADYSDIKRSLKINLNFLGKAIRELLLNAMKFSLKGSDIYIFTSCTHDRFYVSIMNEPEKNITGHSKIDKEYEKLIFEPFFRLVKNVYEEYETLDFGLGLSLVEKIVRKNYGRVTLSNVTDSTSMDGVAGKEKINFEVAIPLVD